MSLFNLFFLLVFWIFSSPFFPLYFSSSSLFSFTNLNSLIPFHFPSSSGSSLILVPSSFTAYSHSIHPHIFPSSSSSLLLTIITIFIPSSSSSPLSPSSSPHVRAGCGDYICSFFFSFIIFFPFFPIVNSLHPIFIFFPSSFYTHQRAFPFLLFSPFYHLSSLISLSSFSR